LLLKVDMNATARLIAVLAVFVAGVLAIVALVFVLLPGVRTQPSAVGGAFSLVDQDGRRVTDADFRGKPFLVFFGFTHCPDVCPTALFELSEVLRRLGPDADKTAVLFITVDPERDTPEKLKEYVSNFHPRIVGLTGSAAEIAGVEKVYRVYAKKVPLEGDAYTMDHSAVVYLMDKDGRFVAPFNLKRTADEAAADLRKRL
jgi:protein SCO1/2